NLHRFYFLDYSKIIMNEHPKKTNFVLVGSLIIIFVIISSEITFYIDWPNVHKGIPNVRRQSSVTAKWSNDTINLDLFLKQMSRAKRFERNPEFSDVMENIVTRLSQINDGHLTKNNLSNNVTIILNGVNEISNIETLLNDIETQPSWSKSVNILIGLNETSYKRHSKRLSRIQSFLPNLKWVLVKTDQTDSIAKTLSNIATKCNTKYVMLTRRLTKIHNKFDINHFVVPLRKGSSDVISGSVLYPDGRWRSGCYQSKLIWSQYKIEFGFDITNQQQQIMCDYFDGPFAMDRDVLLGYLEAKIKTKCQDVLFYPEIIFTMTKQLKIIKSHLSSVFYMEQWQDFENLTRKDWLDFAIRNDISEFYDGDLDKHYEFTNIEAKVKCQKTNKKSKSLLEQRACMRDLHFMLIDTFKLFDNLGYHYNSEDGSGLAAVKLHDTLPWDIDQDFLFRSQNFTSLVQHESTWKKLGMSFGKQLNDPCVKDVNRFKKFSCGYIGIHKGKWKLEAWGVTIFPYDIYKNPNQISYIVRILKYPFPSSRIKGINTILRMGDYWSAFRPNPGLFARGRYGLDILKHSPHWRQQGSSTSWMMYKPKSKFEACTNEGHHLCMDQYLADGNIQFQRPWA
uniref:Uncharacterized protein n=1 Tax=Clytia hemisphaerica TaxID=252671 RepID=A0A7M5UY07_9CNID